MAFSSVSVVLSSLLLRYYKKPKYEDTKETKDQSPENVPLIKDHE